MKTMKEERAAILESFLSMDDRELFLVLTGERGIVAQMYLKEAAEEYKRTVGGDADLRTMVRVICGKEPALLLELIKSAAKEAGKIMLSASEISPETDEKQGHANFVTSYDRRIQEYLFKALHELLPEAHFVTSSLKRTGKDTPLSSTRSTGPAILSQNTGLPWFQSVFLRMGRPILELSTIPMTTYCAMP